MIETAKYAPELTFYCALGRLGGELARLSGRVTEQFHRTNHIDSSLMADIRAAIRELGDELEAFEAVRPDLAQETDDVERRRAAALAAPCSTEADR